jgi:ADP-heptose:LPS heptosyltransferase
MRFLGDVRRHNFDTWVELEHYYRFTTVMGYLSGAKVRVGFDVPTQVRKYLFTITAAYPTDKHELEAFYAIARVLGADESGMSPIPILVSDDDKRRVSEWLAQAVQSLPPEDRGRGLAVFHTTTSPVSVGRRWPTERWAELADKVARLYGLTIVLTGAPEDVEVLEQLAGQMAKRPLIAAGHLNLRQFSHLAATAQLMVSVDTGPLHVAAATDVPIVALFGPADMRKWRPYKSNGVAISAGLACSPCTTHYLGKISAKTCSDCMQGISVSDVLAAIETLPGGPIRVGSRDGDQ